MNATGSSNFEHGTDRDGALRNGKQTASPVRGTSQFNRSYHILQNDRRTPYLDAGHGVRIAAAAAEHVLEIGDAKHIFGAQVLNELLAPHNAARNGIKMQNTEEL